MRVDPSASRADAVRPEYRQGKGVFRLERHAVATLRPRLDKTKSKSKASK